MDGIEESCSAENDRTKLLGRRRAFALTYAVSLIVHSARKSYSCIKPAFLDEDWLSATASASGVKGREGLLLAVPDSSFLLCYGIFIVIGGRAADTFDARLIMCAALLSTAVFLFMFALGGVLHVHTLVFFGVIWGLHGLTQSPAWPACVSTMGRWYAKGVRGGVMGWWSSSANVGNLAATALSSIIFAVMGTRQSAWSLLMGIIGVVTLVIMLLVYCFLIPEPTAEGTVRLTPDTRWDNDLAASFLEKNTVEALDGDKGGTVAPRALSFIRAVCLPGVLEVGAAYAALKGCSYALFFWLPVFLRLKTGVAVQQANSIAMVFDVGQVLGALGGGHLSDKLRAPLTVNLVFLLGSALPLYFLGSSGTSLPTLVMLLVLAGCLSGGPQNLIATVVSQDLGQSPTIKGNARALATVAAVIDGMGSLGAAGMQYMVGSLFPCAGSHSAGDDEKADCDWRPMFLLLTVGQVFASLLLLRHAVKELRGRSGAPSDDGRDTPEAASEEA